LRFDQEIQVAASSEGISFGEFMRRAAAKALHGGDTSRFREITLTPRGDSTVDDLFAWLCARRPMLADIVPEGGVLPYGLRRSMERVLTKRQIVRIEHVILEGGTLENIGRSEGCSKQAVDASIRRALTRLSRSPGFVEALCRAFPDSGITPVTLIRAAEAQNAQKACEKGRSARRSTSNGAISAL